MTGRQGFGTFVPEYTHSYLALTRDIGDGGASTLAFTLDDLSPYQYQRTPLIFGSFESNFVLCDVIIGIH